MSLIKKFASSKFGRYIYEFGEYTTLHGLRYIILPNMHFLETLVWLLAVIISCGSATTLILNSWERYNANPTVISLQKNFRDWKITYPSATFCFLQPLDENLAEEFINKRWNVDQNSTEHDLYLEFLNSITNLTYENLDDFNKYLSVKELEMIDGNEMAKIAYELKRKIVYNLNVYNESYNVLKFHETLTEMGICYTFAGIASRYVNFKKIPAPKNINLPKCNYLTSLCYARVEDIPSPIKFYVHSPNELPDSTDKYYIVLENMERDTTFRFQETVSAPELKKLDIRQRNCRFMYENQGNDEIYSYNLCRMACRKRLAKKLCGCAPYFYMKNDRTPICGVKGLACLSKYKEQIQRLIDSSGNDIDCQCLPLCENSVYFLDKDDQRQWTYPVPRNIRFRWAIERYSKTRYKRDIIFGFEDLLVSFGGTAALFLGCSVLTFVEILYFFTIRLFYYVIDSKNNKIN